MSSNGDREGLFDRLAKTIFASESSPFSQFADQQRAERLASCRQLETILNACHAESNSGRIIGDDSDGGALTSDNTADAEIRSGTKIARFFRWDKPKEVVQSSSEAGGISENNTTTEEIANGLKTKYSQGCHKETHELWACRALALGCGGHLKDLRQVWNEENLVTAQNDSETSSSEITYEDRKSCEDKAREIQQKMAKCVTNNASELAERIEARRNKK